MLVRCLSALLVAFSLLTHAPAQAADHPVVPVAAGVSYQWIDRWDADRLNRVLTADAPTFFGVPIAASPARNAVNLYRVTYSSVVPEQGNRPIVTTGLVAVPEGATGGLPVFSYQHGTVYGKEEVPSIPDQSAETRLALALFAGQGYVVIGADYFGMGDTKEPEGYVVKGSHQQATFDMLLASRAVLQNLGVTTTKLFLGGWSQGGFVTMAFLEKLENSGVPVAAAATASAPVDAFVMVSGALDFPRKIDAVWMNSVFILSAFSFENYYGVPGLARALFTDEAYDVARKVYEREKVDFAAVPTDLHKLIRPEYFDPKFLAASTYGRLLLDKTNAYRWVIQTPTRNYYGEADEAIAVGLGRLAMTFQQAMGAGNPAVEALSTGAMAK